MKLRADIRTVMVALLAFAITSCSPSKTSGSIKGVVQIPNDIKLEEAPAEAKVYIALKNYATKEGKPIPPWEAPTLEVVETQINALERHRMSFAFQGVPTGIYGISVLIDTGRPHVHGGSLDFTAYPGDYAGGTNEHLRIEADQTVEVSISEGLYVPIPDGYQAPLYLTD